MTDALDHLIDRATRGVLLTDEGTALRAAVQALRDQALHLAASLRSAEDELAEWRNGQHAAQLADAYDGLDDDLFFDPTGEYPPHLDGLRHMLRRGRWLPIEDGPAVYDYQP